MNNPCGGLKLSSFSYVKMEMQNILTLQKINFDLQVKSGQLMLNDHTGTRLFIRTAQKQSGHQQCRSGTLSPLPLSTPTSLIMIHCAQKCFHS